MSEDEGDASPRKLPAGIAAALLDKLGKPTDSELKDALKSPPKRLA